MSRIASLLVLLASSHARRARSSHEFAQERDEGRTGSRSRRLHANFVVIDTNNSIREPGNSLQTEVAISGRALDCLATR